MKKSVALPRIFFYFVTVLRTSKGDVESFIRCTPEQGFTTPPEICRPYVAGLCHAPPLGFSVQSVVKNNSKSEIQPVEMFSEDDFFSKKFF